MEFNSGFSLKNGYKKPEDFQLQRVKELKCRVKSRMKLIDVLDWMYVSFVRYTTYAFENNYRIRIRLLVYTILKVANVSTYLRLMTCIILFFIKQ